jgi:hypothetical protein
MYFISYVYGHVKDPAERLEETENIRVRRFNRHGKLSYIGHDTGLPTWKEAPGGRHWFLNRFRAYSVTLVLPIY